LGYFKTVAERLFFGLTLPAEDAQLTISDVMAAVENGGCNAIEAVDEGCHAIKATEIPIRSVIEDNIFIGLI
jgi:hypothetical protein